MKNVWYFPKCVLVLFCLVGMLQAADFSVDTGSDGSDGALDLSEAGTIVFDPASFSPALDQDGDNIYHFTSVNIASGVTLKLSSSILGTRPVIFLVSGDVTIDGVINLSGESGHDFGDMARFSVAGAGGYDGGAGSKSTLPPYRGNGPGGGGTAPDPVRGGGGGGYAVDGGDGAYTAGRGGSAYGNKYLLPLIGGSGGGGGGAGTNAGGGGGAGGGALLIASSSEISLGGYILANGGQGGTAEGTSRGGGGGSGGAIRLVAPTISGAGTIRANRGDGVHNGGHGSRGRTRLEAFFMNFTGSVSPAPALATPGLLTLPTALAPIRVVSIAGVPVPANPTGDFSPADLGITSTGAITIELEASQVPVGTVVNLTMWNENGSTVAFNSTPLDGTLAATTATATVNVPPGFSRFFVEASWTP